MADADKGHHPQVLLFLHLLFFDDDMMVSFVRSLGLSLDKLL